MTQTAASALVDTLAAHGVDRVFCVPGESYLPVLDVLYDRRDIDTVTARHESGAGFMAVADAKLTGRPGVAFVSRGPGATNASIALHTAEQDAAPLVLFIGQVPRAALPRGGFQQVDYAKTFADIAKAVWQVTEPESLAEVTARAFHVAASDTPAPVVVVLPEDVLKLTVSNGAAAPMPVARTRAAPSDVARVAERVRAAERPLLIAGGQLDDAAGRRALRACAEAWGLPVVTTFKHQDLVDNDSTVFAGHLGFNIPREQLALVCEADLVLAVGTRLNDVSTQGYRFPRAPEPEQPLIHVYPDPARIGRVIRTEIGLACDPAAFLDDLATSAPSGIAEQRTDWLEGLHGYVRRMRAPENHAPDDGVDFGAVVAALSPRLAADAAIVTDAGNFSSWLHRHHAFKASQRLLGAVSGAMGLGVPAAVATALREPARQAVTLVGDGGFLMTGNELSVAVQRGLPVRIFVSNNRSYGTIRLHQEKQYPGRVSATDLANPDFARLAEAFGATGLRLAPGDDVDGVVEQALAAPGPVVVDVHASLKRISANVSLDDLASR